MNPYSVVAIHTLSVCTVVGLAVWLTGSAWALLGLLLLSVELKADDDKKDKP